MSLGKTLVIAAALSVFVPGSVSAATLSISPSASTQTAGSIFTVSVRVSSTDQAMNAVSGILTFPSNLLQVTSLSKSGSIMNLWVQEPSFSNAAGTVDFEGVVLNPGFTGAGGTVLSVTFRALDEGSATLSLAQGSVLANDGSGTEILKGSSGASITIIAAKEPPPAPKAQPAPSKEEKPDTKQHLQAPHITSVTTSVSQGDVAEVRGSSIYRGAIARLTLKREGADPLLTEAVIEQSGIFTITQPHTITPGNYSGSVQVVIDEEASPASELFVIRFEDTPFLKKLLELALQPSVLIAVGLIMAFLFGMACLHFIGGQASHGKTTQGLLHHVDLEVHKAFLELRESINKAIEELETTSENRELTLAEKKFIHDMTGKIKETEKVVSKDIRTGE